MKHHSLITKKPMLAQTDDGADTRKEALVNFKLDATAQLVQAVFNKSLF
jgi:hypothetical protein